MVVAAVTSGFKFLVLGGCVAQLKTFSHCLHWSLLLLLAFANGAFATVLPEERADIMYHEYSGDGIKISGPSVLVRKNFADKVSVSANYYVDEITSASIDVRTYGSPLEPYEEERTEQTIGVDVLNEKNIMSFSYTTSEENDYEAETFFFGMSQDFFGSMTNISIGFGIGDDEIRATGNEELQEKADRQNYRLSLSQILTKKLIMGVNVETVTEEGYLQNPYRKSRIIRENGDSRVSEYINEKYPNTKTSDAISLRFRYYLPHRAALHSDVRYYSDSWDINARNFEIGYTHPLDDYPLTFEFKYRFYSQSDASFYQDSISEREADPGKNFYGRDKELSKYDSTTFGIGVKWEFLTGGWWLIEKGSLSLKYDRIDFVYDNFRDATQSVSSTGTAKYEAGDEPLFEFKADVYRVYATIIY